MNIFVAKLNYSTEEDSLRDVFENYGEVSSVKIVMDRDTGRSKGFGFVEMPNSDQAHDAISGLNDSELDSRRIVVKEAEERPKRSGGGGPRRNNFGNQDRRGGYDRY